MQLVRTAAIVVFIGTVWGCDAEKPSSRGAHIDYGDAVAETTRLKNGNVRSVIRRAGSEEDLVVVTYDRAAHVYEYQVYPHPPVRLDPVTGRAPRLDGVSFAAYYVYRQTR